MLVCCTLCWRSPCYCPRLSLASYFLFWYLYYPDGGALLAEAVARDKSAGGGRRRETYENGQNPGGIQSAVRVVHGGSRPLGSQQLPLRRGRREPNRGLVPNAPKSPVGGRQERRGAQGMAKGEASVPDLYAAEVQGRNVGQKVPQGRGRQTVAILLGTGLLGHLLLHDGTGPVARL